MANLASTAVTLVSSWTEGGTSGKRHVVAIVDLALTGQGDGTDKILATALGFTKIERCGNMVLSDNSAVYPATPAYDGSFIILTNPENATDASRANPATVTGVTGRLWVAGYR